MQETWVQSLSQEDTLEKEMATHSSILSWETPWTEEPGGLQPMELQRVRHDLATEPPVFTPHRSGFWEAGRWRDVETAPPVL